MEKEKYTIKSLIGDVWFYVKPYKGKFFLASFLRLVGDVLWLYPAFALSLIVSFLSNYKAGESMEPLYSIILIWILCAVIRSYFKYKGKVMCFEIAVKTNEDSQMRLLDHLFQLDMSWHEKENSGNKIKRIHRGGIGLERLLRIWIVNFIEISVNFFGIIFIIYKFDGLLSFLLIVFITSFYLISRFFRKRGIFFLRQGNLQEEKISGLMFESINNIRTVKTIGVASNIIHRIRLEIIDFINKCKSRFFWFNIGGEINSFYTTLWQVFLLIFIAFGIFSGKYELGFFVLFYGYFNKISETISEFSQINDDFSSAKSDFSRMQIYLNESIIIDNEDGKEKLQNNWQSIKLVDISFSYGDKNVLDSISFEIERGQKVGIIGLSGAGKSTLFKLLLKENESYNGEIFFDNVPLKTISKKDYLKHTAVVLQETELFNMSLKENIAIGDDMKDTDHSESLLNKAINIAHVKDFMSKLPLGVDTIVGEKGVKLSGGEKQRVGIARAVYKEPELLLMDEATSHLDIESEKKIQESLHEFFKEVTAVVIAHRLTTIKEMDKIIVIEDGKIVEEGNFKELQKRKGRFFDLWEKQKL